MGVLSDLVVAPAGDAERVAHAEVPSQAFGGIDIKGIDFVKFGTLHSIVTGRPFEELLPEYKPVVTVSDEDPSRTFVSARPARRCRESQGHEALGEHGRIRARRLGRRRCRCRPQLDLDAGEKGGRFRAGSIPVDVSVSSERCAPANVKR